MKVEDTLFKSGKPQSTDTTLVPQIEHLSGQKQWFVQSQNLITSVRMRIRMFIAYHLLLEK